jgi:hypothetical protein
MNQNRVLTTPMVITDIPEWDSGLKPREFRIQIPAPNTPAFVNLRLHVMSDTYLKTDQRVEMSMEVCRKDFGPTPKDTRQIGPDKKLFMAKFLSLMCPDSDQVALGKFIERLKKKTSRKKAAIKKTLAAQHGDSDSESDEDEGTESPSPSTQRKGYFSAWNKIAIITRLGCHGLDKHIPDSLETDDWVDWKYCNPNRTGNYVSEWTLPWDYNDDNNGEWEDVKVSRKSMRRFNKRRISLGRDIGADRMLFTQIDDNAVTDSAVSSASGAGSETDSFKFLSVVTPATSENASSNDWESSEPNESVSDEVFGEDPKETRMSQNDD